MTTSQPVTPAPRPEVPLEEYGEQYFKRYNYADRPLSKFSMYWFARRYYAALIRRYAPKGGGRLLELGCGLGHLIGLLQDEYKCVGIDLAEYSIEQTKTNAPKAEAYAMSADDLSRFCQMLLNGGTLDGKRVMSAQTVARMTAPIVVSETGDTRGLGWDINTAFSSNRGELYIRCLFENVDCLLPGQVAAGVIGDKTDLHAVKLLEFVAFEDVDAIENCRIDRLLLTADC